MISECCGAEDRISVYFYKGEVREGPNYSELNKCPICMENCVFISEEEFGNEYARSQEIDALTGDE